jgi:hypothetical protein
MLSAMDDARSWYARADKLGTLGGHHDEVKQLLGDAIAAGYGPALVRLAEFLWHESGQSWDDVFAEVEGLLTQALAEGAPGAANTFGNVLADMGHDDRAEQMFRQAIAEGDSAAETNLAAVLHDRGADRAAYEVLVMAAKNGNDFAYQILSHNIAPADPLWAEISNAWTGARSTGDPPAIFCYRPGSWDLDLAGT